jgi:hypothetical protein
MPRSAGARWRGGAGSMMQGWVDGRLETCWSRAWSIIYALLVRFVASRLALLPRSRNRFHLTTISITAVVHVQ